MAYIGVSPIDVQTTIISGAQNTATLPLANPTFVTSFLLAVHSLSIRPINFFKGCPTRWPRDTGRLQRLGV